MKKSARLAALHLIFIFIFIFVFSSSTSIYGSNGFKYRSAYDIIILYTNDVHCFVDNSIGYDGLVSYKKEMLQKTPYVSLVDCGDHLQGNIMGAASNGSYIIDIMNKARYEFTTIGNHEFDYGLDVLRERIKTSKTKYLNCNATYTGLKEDPFAQTASYSIRTYGLTKVGFIGVVTPKSIGSSTPSNFKENGKFVVDLKGGKNGQELFDAVQQSVDCCIAAGANYVIVLSHLGTNASHAPFNSKFLIANTSGIDVVLDGHSHSVIPEEKVLNKAGKQIILTSTGTALERIGKLTISAEGIKSELISEYKKKDEMMKAFINDIKASLGESINKEIGFSDTSLSISNKDGIRMVRNRETNIGDWVTDAMAYAAKCEIAICNGGGIRADLKAGKVTFGDIYSVHTFNNTLVKAKITGQVLLNLLETGYKFVAKEAIGPDGQALNENGGFFQVSGIKLTIDTSVKSPVKVDENGLFVGLEGTARVKNVSVKVNGKYENLDLNKEYVVAAPAYVTSSGKSGKNRISEESILETYGVLPEAFVEYFKHLDGNLSRYAYPDERIIIE